MIININININTNINIISLAFGVAAMLGLFGSKELSDSDVLDVLLLRCHCHSRCGLCGFMIAVQMYLRVVEVRM